MFWWSEFNILAYDLACLIDVLLHEHELLEEFKSFRVCAVRVINA